MLKKLMITYCMLAALPMQADSITLTIRNQLDQPVVCKMQEYFEAQYISVVWNIHVHEYTQKTMRAPIKGRLLCRKNIDSRSDEMISTWFAKPKQLQNPHAIAQMVDMGDEEVFDLRDANTLDVTVSHWKPHL